VTMTMGVPMIRIKAFNPEKREFVKDFVLLNDAGEIRAYDADNKEQRLQILIPVLSTGMIFNKEDGEIYNGSILSVPVLRGLCKDIHQVVMQVVPARRGGWVLEPLHQEDIDNLKKPNGLERTIQLVDVPKTFHELSRYESSQAPCRIIGHILTWKETIK